MKTITFYSYKGGVGRSLCLANMATRLSEFGKKVCLLDFDLEAPGLHYKFNTYKKFNFQKGITDYIYDFSENRKIADSINEYAYEIPVKAINNIPLTIIPAGNVYTKEYWSKLSAIDWNNLFYENENIGIPFFLDLKERIKKELNPDFLLIDSRTGITEIGGISLSLWADEIVLLAANNDENIEGSKHIMASLFKKENQINKKPPKIDFVLTRIPYPMTPEERVNESYLKESVQETINSFFKKSQLKFQINNILIIHSDRELELKETLKISDDKASKVIPISQDYVKLFEEITKNELTPEEIDKFNNIKESQKLVEKANLTKDYIESIELFSKAIELNNNNIDAYEGRGLSFFNSGKFEDARKDYATLIKLLPNHYWSYFTTGVTYLAEDRNYSKALEYLNKSIKYNPQHSESLSRRGHIHFLNGDNELAKKDFDNAVKYSPNSYMAYNARGNWCRLTGNFKQAYSDIYKAIELNPQAGVPYGTLGEIKAAENKINDFYVNLEIALQFSTENMSNSIREEDIYKKFINEDRFKNLLIKYNIEL